MRALAIAVALFVTRAASAQVYVRLVALDGDPAPSGGTFSNTGSYAVMNGNGQVMFGARLLQGPAPNAIFRWSPDGTIVEVARLGEAIPGSLGDRTVPSLDLASFGFADDGSIAFGSDRQISWVRSPGGSFQILAEVGMPCPNFPENPVSEVPPPLYTLGGRVYFGFNICSAIWSGTPGNVAPVISVRDPVPGWEGSSPPAEFSDLFGISGLQNDAGHHWFSAAVSCRMHPLCMANFGASQGLFVRTGGAITTIARRNDPAPGVAGGLLYDGFLPIAVGAGGQALVYTTLYCAIDTPGCNAALYLFDPSGGATLVAAEGDPVPGVPGATWIGFSRTANFFDAAVAGDGSVIFKASIAGPTIAPGSDATVGIWRRDPAGQIGAVVRGGDPAPSMLGNFRAPGPPVVSPTGRVAFIAMVGPRQMLFIENSAGELVRALSELDVVEVGRGEPIQISGLFLGGPNATGADGRGLFFHPSGDLLVISGDLQRGSAILLVRVEQPAKLVDLVGLEVVQVAQDWIGSVPLVARKPTFVRAHVEAPDPTIARGRLRARRNGAELPGSPFSGTSFGALTVAEFDAQPSRAQLGGAMYFELPPEWTAAGELELELEADPRANIELTCRESAGAPGDCKVTARFEEVPELDVRFWALGAYVVDERNNYRRAVSDVVKLRAELPAIYPISKLKRRPVRFVDKDLATIPFFDHELKSFWMETVIKGRLAEGCGDDCKTIDYGVYPIPPRELGGRANGIPGSAAIGDAFFWGWPRFTQAHELGHVLGRHHAVHSMFGIVDGKKQGACGERGAAEAPDWPWFYTIDGRVEATIGPIDDRERIVYGLDATIPKVIDPRKHFELMSYCDRNLLDQQVWISGQTYAAVKSAIAARFPAMPPAPRPVEAVRFIPGVLTATGTMRLGRVSWLETSAPPRPAPGSYTLRALDAAGTMIESVSFEPEPSVSRIPIGATGDGAEDAFFALSLPAELEPAALVVVDSSGRERARLTASPNPPVVTVLAPNGGEDAAADMLAVRWSANDPDGDELSFDVSVSGDGGATWSLVGSQLLDTSFEVPRAQLAGSRAAIVRVDASDGVNVASDKSDAPFTIRGSAPLVEILRPRDRSLAAAGDPIFFEGAVEDRELDALEWISDRDGMFATGSTAALSAAQLSDGDHRITLRATDSEGLIGTAEVGLRVRRAVPAAFHDVTISGRATPNPVRPGGALAVELTIANAGPHDAPAVSLELEAPGELGCSESCAPCTLSAIARAAEATMTLSCTPTASGVFVIVARASAGDGDPILANDHLELTVVVDERGGSNPEDAGAIAVDAGAGDSGEAPIGSDAGCGCTTSRSAHLDVLFLLVLALLLRRR